MATNIQKLPDHPGDLIRLAVLDLVAAASMPERYRIDMDTWHDGRTARRKRCVVCMAGSVMARSLRVRIDRSIIPHTFDSDVCGKLEAINYFRAGDILSAYWSLGRSRPSSLPLTVSVANWRGDKSLFLADMLDLAAMIDEAEAQEGSHV